MENKGNILNIVIGTIVILVFIGLSYINLPVFKSIDKSIYDKETSFISKGEKWGKDIVLIDIDAESLKRIGQWPWSRHLFADMIDILEKNQVKLIGLDIPFFEPEINPGLDELRQFKEKYRLYPPTSKDKSLKNWVLDGLGEWEKKLDSDKRFIESVKRSNKVVLPGFVTIVKSNKKTQEEAKRYISRDYLNPVSPPSPGVLKKLTVDNLTLPYADLGESSLGIGHANLSFDNIMKGRLHPLYVVYKGAFIPSFPLRLAIGALGQKPNEISIAEDLVELGDRIIPLFKGEMLVDLMSSSPDFSRFSFVDLLNSKKPVKALKGKIAIIGFGQSGGGQFLSPIAYDIPQTDLIARILGNIISNNYISRPFFMMFIEIAIIFVLGLFFSVAVSRRRLPARFIWTVVLILLLLVIGFVALSMLGLWLKTAHVIGCLLIIFVCTLIKDFFSSEKFGLESHETSRMLGLSFQSQGELDQALDKFKKLPFNSETKELIYNIGLAYEKKRMPNKALSAYEYLNRKGEYKDIHERIIKIKASDKSSTMGSFSGIDRGSILSEIESRPRSKVGRYEILGELGKGSMGLVYKAQDPKINRLVAIKTIRFSDEFDDDVIEEVKERFFREAEIAGQLNHPSIVTIHDVGYDGELTYMAMEYLEGKDLEVFIRKKNLLGLPRVLDIVARTADALDFAHKADVIHRDIKPANIMLLKNGQIKMTDFGIAKALSSSRTKTGVILGTPNYMSPEQIMGQKIDARSDIFSLGVLFFQLLTGELPFHGENLSALLYQITQAKHPSPRDYKPKTPKICAQIIDKAMAKNPKNRFNNAGEMAKVIRVLLTKIDKIRKKGVA